MLNKNKLFQDKEIVKLILDNALINGFNNKDKIEEIEQKLIENGFISDKVKIVEVYAFKFSTYQEGFRDGFHFSVRERYHTGSWRTESFSFTNIMISNLLEKFNI